MISSSAEVVRPGQSSWLGSSCRLEATLPLHSSEGRTTLILRIDVYYCDNGNAASCYIERREFSLPVSVATLGEDRIELNHIVRTANPQ